MRGAERNLMSGMIMERIKWCSECRLSRFVPFISSLHSTSFFNKFLSRKQIKQSFNQIHSGVSGIHWMERMEWIEALFAYSFPLIQHQLANNIKLMFHYPKGIVSNYCYNNISWLHFFHFTNWKKSIHSMKKWSDELMEWFRSVSGSGL